MDNLWYWIIGVYAYIGICVALADYGDEYRKQKNTALFGAIVRVTLGAFWPALLGSMCMGRIILWLKTVKSN